MDDYDDKNSIPDIIMPPTESIENEEYNLLLSSKNKSHSAISKIQLVKQVVNNSTFLTVFLLVNSMIGSGILNQPYVFMKSGILGGLIGFVFGIVCTWGGLILLTESGIHCNVLEYGNLSSKVLGRFGDRFTDFSIISLSLGCQLGYFIVIGETSTQLLLNWGCNHPLYCNQFNITLFESIVFIAPVCMFRKFGHLAIISVLSVTAIVLCIFLVAIAGPIVTEDEVKTPLKLFDWKGTVMSTGSIVLALNCASSNFHAFVSADSHLKGFKPWVTITGIAIAIGACMCLIMGVTGYVAFRDKTNGQILNNFESNHYDFFKVMMVCHLIFYIPVQFLVMRYSLVKQIWNIKSEDMSWMAHFAFTIFLLIIIVSIVLVLVANNQATGATFALLVDLVGGISGAMLAFIIPGFIYLNLPDKEEAETPCSLDETVDETENHNSTRSWDSQTQQQRQRQTQKKNRKLNQNSSSRVIWLQRLSYFNITVGIIVMANIIAITIYTHY